MFKRSALLAIAAIFTLGLAAFAPTSASAKFGGGGGHGGGHFGKHGGGVHISHGMHRGHSFHFRRPIRIVRWHNPRPRIIVRPAYVKTYAAVRPIAAYAVAPAPTCTCLTKEYLPDGTVLFKDACTKEMAMNPPNIEQAQGPEVQVK
jgi:hypothetical protein